MRESERFSPSGSGSGSGSALGVNAHYPARAVRAERITRDQQQHDTLKTMLNTAELEYDVSSRASSSSTVTGTRVRVKRATVVCAGS